MALAALEDSRDKRGAAARAVLREQEVEFVVDAHHLRNSALHHVLEMRMISAIEREEKKIGKILCTIL